VREPFFHVAVNHKMKRAKRRLAMAVCGCTLIALLGCDSQVVYQEVSRSFPEIIGARYRVKRPVLAYGIRKHSRAPIEYIQLMPPPGIAGSQIVPLTPIPVGTLFKVVSAWKSNTVTPNTHSVLVELENYTPPENVPIRIEYFRGNNQYWWGFELNSDFYERVPKRSGK
jgi:hypothetical protein